MKSQIWRCCRLCMRVGTRGFLREQTGVTGYVCLYEVPCMDRQRRLGRDRVEHPLAMPGGRLGRRRSEAPRRGHL